eukprot:gene9067-1162_t
MLYDSTTSKRYSIWNFRTLKDFCKFFFTFLLIITPISLIIFGVFLLRDKRQFIHIFKYVYLIWGVLSLLYFLLIHITSIAFYTYRFIKTFDKELFQEVHYTIRKLTGFFFLVIQSWLITTPLFFISTSIILFIKRVIPLENYLGLISVILGSLNSILVLLLSPMSYFSYYSDYYYLMIFSPQKFKYLKKNFDRENKREFPPETWSNKPKNVWLTIINDDEDETLVKKNTNRKSMNGRLTNKNSKK